jgi:hypothetical protein
MWPLATNENSVSNTKDYLNTSDKSNTNSADLKSGAILISPAGSNTLILFNTSRCSSTNLHVIRFFYFDIWCFNATFSNISAISWRPVLMVEEAGVPGENHRPWASNWKTLSLATVSRVHPYCNLQSRERTHAVLVIGLYELLGNPTGSDR